MHNEHTSHRANKPHRARTSFAPQLSQQHCWRWRTLCPMRAAAVALSAHALPRHSPAALAPPNRMSGSARRTHERGSLASPDARATLPIRPARSLPRTLAAHNACGASPPRSRRDPGALMRMQHCACVPRRQVQWICAADRGADGSGAGEDSPDGDRGVRTRANRGHRVNLDRERRLLHLTVSTPVATTSKHGCTHERLGRG